MEVGGAFVRIRLDRSSLDILDGLADLFRAIDEADVLMPEPVLEATARLRAALLQPDGVSFGMTDDPD